MDLKVLGSKHKTVCIPPPVWTPTGAMPAAQEEIPITMQRLICALPLLDGNTCKEEFSNMIKLRAHRTTATVHRNVFPRPYNLVVNNLCPWCMTVYNKKNTVQSHATRAFKQGMCTTLKNNNKLKGSIYNVDAENPDDVLYCVYCDISFESWHAYKMHVLSHGTPETGLVTLLDTAAVPAQTKVVPNYYPTHGSSGPGFGSHPTQTESCEDFQDKWKGGTRGERNPTADHQAHTQNYKASGSTEGLFATELDVSKSVTMHDQLGGDEGEVPCQIRDDGERGERSSGGWHQDAYHCFKAC